MCRFRALICPYCKKDSEFFYVPCSKFFEKAFEPLSFLDAPAQAVEDQCLVYYERRDELQRTEYPCRDHKIKDDLDKMEVTVREREKFKMLHEKDALASRYGKNMPEDESRAKFEARVQRAMAPHVLASEIAKSILEENQDSGPEGLKKYQVITSERWRHIKWHKFTSQRPAEFVIGEEVVKEILEQKRTGRVAEWKYDQEKIGVSCEWIRDLEK